MSRDLQHALRHLRDVVDGLEMRVALSGPRLLVPDVDFTNAIVLGDDEPDFAVIDEAIASGAIDNVQAFDAVVEDHRSARVAQDRADAIEDERASAWEVRS